MKKSILSLFIIGTFSSFGQNRIASADSNWNFYNIKKDVEKYFKKKLPNYEGEEDEKEEGGYDIYKRWASYMEPRVYPSGDIRNVGPRRAYYEFQEYLKSNPMAKNMGNATITSTTANWVPLGPFGSALGTGAGRIQCIRFKPGAPSTIYAGTAAGGLWVTTNNGANWSTTTDQIASLGVADVAIDPTNTNIMYIATGDLDGSGSGWPAFAGGDTKSVGVLKSTDGGLTWNTTGLSWTPNQIRFISRLLINPLNTVEIFAFTSVGIYRTRNAGTSWVLVTGGNYKDAEYKPNDTTTIYAANGASLYRSTNSGNNFVNTSFSSAGLSRISIAVTAADPNYVYVVGANTSSSFGGAFRSINSGTNWTTMATTPNILGGTQGWYDLTIAASPTNKDEVIVGGIDLWRSINGGTNWTQITSGYGAGPPYIHPDQHSVNYQSGTSIFAGHDGGVSMSTNSGSTWSTINGNMNISEPYFLGSSASSSVQIIAGLQDNGTILWNGTSWTLVKGGDGMACFIDWNNNSTMVGSYVNGAHARSTNGGATFGNIVTGLTGNGNWVAPIIQDPNTASIFYAGRQDVFKSTNQGTSWSQIGALGGTGDVLKIRPCPSNSSVIYASRSTNLYKTTNGGTTWTNISLGLPVSFAQIADIDVDNTNANNVYVTFSGYSAGNKVFYSNDGGATWTNYSTGLPNIPANCIVFTKNSPGAIYVGTDVGVYYRELSMSSFIPYFNGLPNVYVNDIEIYYPTGKLRAATYGRGIWQTDLYSNVGVVPNAYFTSSSSTICVGSSVGFTDGSSNNPTSWAWSFPGGTPSSSAVKNPASITYSATGVYTVSLVATNSVGASSAYTAAINVINTPTSVPTNTGTCAGQPNQLQVTTNASNVIWQGGQTGPSASFAPTVTTVYSYTVFTGACQSTGTATMTVGPAPGTPTFSQLGNILTSSSAAGYQWYLNGNPIPGATTQTLDISATGDGFYSVWVNNGMGCEVSSTAIYLTTTGVNNAIELSGIQISPNPATNVLFVELNSKAESDFTYDVINPMGQVVRSGKITQGTTDKTVINLDGLSAGIYHFSLTDKTKTLNYKFVKN